MKITQVYLKKRGIIGPWGINPQPQKKFHQVVVIPSYTELEMLPSTLESLNTNNISILENTLVIVVINHGEDSDSKVKENSEKWVRAKESLKWLIARLPEESRYTILTFNEKVNSHTRHGWLSGKDPIGVKSALGDALKEIPKGGTNLEKVLEQVMDMRPRPDSVYLITDGLPTKGQPVKGISLDKVKKCFRTGTKSKPIRTITAECRVELFFKALRNYLKEN